MTRLPRGKPGDELTWSWLNGLVDAVEVALRVTVDPTSGLEMQDTPSGKSLRLSRRPGAAKYYRLTSALASAATLSAVTSASAVPQKLTGTTLADDGTATVTVRNVHDKSFASSSIVWAEPDDAGNLWVLDVRSCANLS